MLVPARDPDALSRAILDLACDDAHRRDMGAQSRTEIERSFGLDICARAYDDLYRQIMSRPPQGKA